MHRALLIAEIQLYIFNQILETQTLYALARTCQAFSETALNVLWGNLGCFPRLIQCMPGDLWKKSETDEPEGRFSCFPRTQSHFLALRRPISLSDWAILQKYTRRVRSVRGPNRHYGSGTRITIDDGLLLELCALSAPTPLLPNLTSLTWHIISDVHLSALQQLVPSSLRSLDLHFECNPFGRLSLDPNSTTQFPFAQIFPSLKFLAVNPGSDFPTSVYEGLQPSISRLQSLDMIIWHDLRSETIMLLAHLPALAEATFDVPSYFSEYVESLPPRSSMRKLPFSKVRKLFIRYSIPVAVLSFLNYFTFDWTPYILVSLASSSSRNIRSLRVDGWWPRIPKESRTEYSPLTKHKLGPLLHFKELQHLSIRIQCSIILNDADLLEMADAWPNLITLRLDGYPRPVSRVTPYALVALLDRCPKLNTLSIQVDFSAIDRADFDPSSIADLFNSCHRNRRDLRDLCFG
ncbi:hypothetical protein BJ138DRAFT_1167276, partial [Hygrophoropsis aurantiaca]